MTPFDNHRFDPVRGLGILAAFALNVAFWGGLACLIWQVGR